MDLVYKYSSDLRSGRCKRITRLGADSRNNTKCSVKTRLGCASVLLVESSLANRSGNRLQIQGGQRLIIMGVSLSPRSSFYTDHNRAIFFTLSLLGEIYFFQTKCMSLTPPLISIFIVFFLSF